MQLKLLVRYDPSVLLVIFSKADGFLLPCPFKRLTGLDCPGCGFQRSLLALVRGDWQASLHFYPPTLLFLVSALAALLSHSLKWDTNAKWLKALYLATGLAVLVSYGYKIVTHQLH